MREAGEATNANEHRISASLFCHGRHLDLENISTFWSLWVDFSVSINLEKCLEQTVAIVEVEEAKQAC